MFTFLLLGARYINAGHSIDLRGVVERAASKSWTADNTTERSVSVEELRPGIAFGYAKGAVPVDGRTEDPQVVIDEAVLSGESDWPENLLEIAFIAGTLNLGKGFAMSVTARFDQSR